MKTVLLSLLLGFGLFAISSQAQTLNSSLEKVALINEVSDLFNNSFRPAEKVGCSISLHGLVAEWDSLAQFSIQYDLYEIDWKNSEIIVESREMAFIAANCVGQEHCITATDAKNKNHFYRNASFFGMPVSQIKKLEVIRFNLIRLKEIESKKF
ncbi:MAG: hypothetical protein K8F24_07040 [Bacteroidales bacterium]|nr:hypothetical protein [Bacteroidales bacterium]